MSRESDSEFVNVDKWVSEDDAVDPARPACPFVRGRARSLPSVASLCPVRASCPVREMFKADRSPTHSSNRLEPNTQSNLASSVT